MKVILMENVPSLGERGKICVVADGYARNFLFPQELAKPATEQAIAEIESSKNKKKKQAEQELGALQDQAAKLDGFEVHIEAPVSDSGTLYAGVGSQKIASELRQAGYNIKKTQIDMESIKEPGEFAAKINFEHGLEAQISILVTEAP